MTPTTIDLEICPGYTELALQLAAVGRSRRSAENTRTRKRLGRAIRKALAPIVAQTRRFVGTWSTPDAIDLRGTPLTPEEFTRVCDEANHNFCRDYAGPVDVPPDLRVFLNLGPPVIDGSGARDVPSPPGIPADVDVPVGFIYVPEDET